MKTIEVDGEFYSYITSRTKYIDESASNALRRMSEFSAASQPTALATKEVCVAPPAIVETKPVKTIRDKVRVMRELLFSDEHAEQKRVANHFILLLSILYSLDVQALAGAAESLHGHTRVYSVVDEQALLKNGDQTKPKHVPDTPYWMITNTSTGRKCNMIKHIVQSMQLLAELIEKVCGAI